MIPILVDCASAAHDTRANRQLDAMSTPAMQLKSGPVTAPVRAEPAPVSADSSHVGALALWLEPVAPEMSILDVGERFLDSASAPWLSLPVVAAGTPVGSIN